MSLDTEAIRKRLQQTESLFWENDCRDLEDMCEADLAFIANAPTDIAALLSEVDRLTAENEALRADLARAIARVEALRSDCADMQERLRDFGVY